MLNSIKLRMFTKAVLLKLERGQDLDEVLAGYTKLNEEEKQQLRKAIEASDETKEA